MKSEHMFPCMGVLHLRTPKQRCDPGDVTFLDPYFSLKTYFRHFPTRRAYFFLKLKFRFFFFFFFFFCRSLCCRGFKPGQQKVREHGSGALRKWQTKLRKWRNLGKEKKEENKERKKGQMGNEDKDVRWKEKEEEEGKKRKADEDKIFLKIIE